MFKYVYEVVVRSCIGEEYTAKAESTDAKKHLSNKAKLNSDLAHIGSTVVHVNHDGVMNHE